MKILIKLILYGILLNLSQTVIASEYTLSKQVENQHRELLAMAREGKQQLQKSVPKFKKLQQQNPRSILILNDYIAILGWANQDKTIMGLLPQLDIGKIPVYVLEAVGRAARNEKQFDKAVYFYQQGVRRFPDVSSLNIGLGLAYSDHKQHKKAIKQLKMLHENRPKNIEIMFALAYAYRAIPKYVDALALYEKILVQQPNNRDAKHLKILAAHRLGAPHRAIELANQSPDLLTEIEYRRLLSDRAAIRTRWGAYAPTTEKQRFSETDIALKRLDNYDQRLAEAGEKIESTLRHNIRFDKIVALRDRVRMRDAIKEYEYLHENNIALPCYTQIAVADAYLYEKQADIARDLYIDILKHCTKEFNTHIALFYSYIENEQWDEAFKLIDAMAAEEPAYLKGKKGKIYRQNPDKLTADITAAMARAYAGLLTQAQQRLEKLLQSAPFNNNELRTNLATIYRWRGWPERAKEEYELALAEQPDNIKIQIGYAHTLMDLNEHQQAEPIINAVSKSHPEDKDVQELAWFWKLHNSWELTVDAVFNMTGSQFGNRDKKIDSYLYAPPLLYHYKPYLHTFYAQSKFNQSTASYRRVGAGLQYQAKRLFLAGELSQRVGGNEWGDNIGVSLFAGWRFNDQWQINTRIDSFAVDIPLQARFLGIDGSMGEVSVNYVAHESRNAGLSSQILDFSDNNTREKISGHLEQRLFTNARFTLDGKVEAYASKNSLGEQQPYFNPTSDLSAGMAFNADHIGYRSYDKVFRQRLIPSIGQYWQKNYQRDWYGVLRYEHDWLLSESFKFLYGISRSRMVYDGQAEYETNLYMTLDWRF